MHWFSQITKRKQSLYKKVNPSQSPVLLEQNYDDHCDNAILVEPKKQNVNYALFIIERKLVCRKNYKLGKTQKGEQSCLMNKAKDR